VRKRASLFLSEAKECGLEIYPYDSGFFLSIPCQDAFKASRKLTEENIFLAPTRPTSLRVSLSCLPTGKIHGLAAKIKKAMD
jgi:aromatic-amino-acid transaminase